MVEVFSQMSCVILYKRYMDRILVHFGSSIADIAFAEFSGFS